MTVTASDPGARSGALAGVSFVAGVAGAMALADAPYPRPGADPAQIQRYFSGNTGPARLSVTGQAVSAVALARFTASVVRLAGRAGPGARPLQVAAVAGGTLASASLATAAACAAALTAGPGRRPASAATLARRGFLAGGPVHTVGFGVLVGALGLAGLRSGELPRPLAVAALASAAASLASPLYFLAEPAGWLIPAGRFSGLLVSGIAGARLAGGRG
jgi:hypothetical protein